MMSRYAVVADEETMAALLGTPSTSLVGVCVVDGGTATCQVLDGRSGLAEAVKGLPCSPSGYGAGTALPDFASEMEALALIADEAASAAADMAEPIFPAGFMAGLPRMAGGLSCRLTEYGLDIAVSLDLAAGIGWKEGDRVSLGRSTCGSLLVVSKGGSGATLARHVSDPGSLHLDRDLSGIPLHVRLGETAWQAAEYQLAGSSVILAVPDAGSGGAKSQPPAMPEPGGHAGAEVRRIPAKAMLAAALLACGAAAGFLTGAFWL